MKKQLLSALTLILINQTVLGVTFKCPIKGNLRFRVLAFVSGLHPRLGNASLVQQLPHHLVQEIIQLTRIQEAIAYWAAKTQSEKDSTLLLASKIGNLPLVSILLSPRVSANINATNPNKTSPLMHAATYNHLRTAKALLALGSNINATDFLGKTPLHYASSGGHLQMVKLLLSCNADTRITTAAGGYTALNLAVKRKQPEIAALLRAHEAR